MWPSGGPSRPGAVSTAGTIAGVVMSARADVSCGAAETLAAPSSAGPVAAIAAGERRASDGGVALEILACDQAAVRQHFLLEQLRGLGGTIQCGSAIGAIFGALAFRAIGDLLFDFDVEPLWQPLFQGLVLLVAVCVGAARLVRVRNRLDLFG